MFFSKESKKERIREKIERLEIRVADLRRKADANREAAVESALELWGRATDENERKGHKNDYHLYKKSEQRLVEEARELEREIKRLEAEERSW